MSHENVELVRRGYEHLAQTGEPPWDLWSPDVQITNLPEAPWQPSPGVKGVREWIDFADDVAEEWRIEVDDYVDLGPRQVLASIRLWMKFRATGIAEEAPMVHVCTIAEGKVTRIDTYSTREQALQAVGP